MNEIKHFTVLSAKNVRAKVNKTMGYGSNTGVQRVWKINNNNNRTSQFRR